MYHSTTISRDHSSKDQLITIPLFLEASPTIKGADTTSLAINTSSGIFAPYFDRHQPNVASFLDIPYAETPIGNLRFTSPVAKRTTGDDIIHATKLPAGCIQYMPASLRGTVGDGPITAGTFQRGDYANTTEDCLKLSLFVPEKSIRTHDKKSRALPVIVWIHGGGYSVGGTNVPYQLAQNWVQRTQKQIVVQVQYRLNLLGFPNARGLAREGNNLNLGLLDQRLAVEWVRNNIARFGGDPDRITLWGESAGAYAVDGYLFAWAQDPIIKGVIADSGNALAIERVVGDSRNHTAFSVAAKSLGCGELSPKEELECMRQVAERDLKKYLQAEVGQGGAADDGLSISVIADNVTVFSNYTERISGNPFKYSTDVPILIGTNTNEGAAVVPYKFPGFETATILPDQLKPLADGFRLNLQCTTLKETRLRAGAGAITYQYLYAGNFTNISPLPWLGAYHTAELPLVFGTHEIEGPSTKFERMVSERMQDLYLKFASDPTHGLEKYGWPSAKPQLEKSKLFKLAADNKVEQIVGAKKLVDECVENGFAV
jgi:acetylcholinesterase